MTTRLFGLLQTLPTLCAQRSLENNLCLHSASWHRWTERKRVSARTRLGSRKMRESHLEARTWRASENSAEHLVKKGTPSGLRFGAMMNTAFVTILVDGADDTDDHSQEQSRAEDIEQGDDVVSRSSSCHLPRQGHADGLGSRVL